jgi:hypothetical protein
MNFNEWFKDRADKSLSKMARIHPLMFQLRKKADSLLIKNYDNKIKSIFDSDSFQPTIIDKLYYNLINLNQRFSILKSSTLIYNNLIKFSSLIGKSLSNISNMINNKFDSIMIKENKTQIKFIENTKYNYNTKLYRLLVFRKYGNFIREIFQVQKYFILQPRIIQVKPYYSIFYKIFKIINFKRKIKVFNVLFCIIIGQTFYNLYELDKQKNIASIDNHYIIFNDKKDKLYLRIYKFTNDIISGKYFEIKEEYKEYIDKSEEITEKFIFTNEKHSFVFYTSLTFITLFFIITSVKSIKNKGFLKKLKLIFLNFIKSYFIFSLILINTNNNFNNDLRYQIVELLLDDKESGEFKFYLDNLKYLKI